MELGQAALATAGFSSIAIFWNYIKNVFYRVSQFVVASVEIEGHYATSAFLGYCWENMKSSPTGAKRFSALKKFIKPRERYGIVGIEVVGKNMTFWDGIKPIFISAPSGKDGDHSIKITFIRGTFNFEKLLYDSVESLNRSKHENKEGKDRYYVKRVFGSNKQQNQPNLAQSTPEKDIEEADSGDKRMIGWKNEDIGAPVSQKPFENLFYTPQILDFENELKRWKNSEKWYKEKGLRWRFGAGLFGPPGTGKTSFIRAIGQDLDMPIHIYDLTTMSNEDLVESWSNSLNNVPCIVLFEDIDRIFDKDKNIKSSKDRSGVTLDCLLNCINGVEVADGILIFVTANDVSKLDPALGVPDETGKSTRPGRLDRAVYFGPLSREARFHIANRILEDYKPLIEETVQLGEGETGAQFESRCGKIALEKYWGEFKVYKEAPVTNLLEVESKVESESYVNFS